MKSIQIFKSILLLILLLVAGCEKNDLITEDPILKAKTIPKPPYMLADTITNLQIYGVWHAGKDYCTWGTTRTISEFDSENHWIINRGDGTPSVNLVVLSFVNPLKLLNKTTDATTLNGLQRGMTSEVIKYFKDAGIRVMLSIGGITYTSDWNAALAKNATQLGLNAAAIADSLGVGIEIDYEQSSDPDLVGLQAFIDAYRSKLPYDATGENHAARLTIDLAAGDRWLIALCRKATADWLRTDKQVLDYANAMVPARQPSASGAIENWDEHIDGKPQYAPPIPPLAPCKFTGALYISGNQPTMECVNFYSSIQYTNRNYVTMIMPNGAGITSGMLGYMFWAAECPSTRQACVTNCTGGLGEGSTYFDIPVPMPPLRQK
ncbi:MAG TPA: hypothetical protein VLQ91_04485 [Draconibacterium sp.]|nr:hypothetical protein [Draconibacterium sp.]